MRKQFYTIAIAGTFDRLHRGHEAFIRGSFRHGERVIIGVTSDQFASAKRKAQSAKIQLKIQNYQDRKNTLDAFLRKEKLMHRVEIVEINDIYGPAIDPESGIEALVVTKETMGGARMVNARRKELGLKPLRIITVPLVMADDKKRIASTRIRLGEIDRWGKVFGKLPILGGKVPEYVRQKLKKPIGKLIKAKIRNPKHEIRNNIENQKEENSKHFDHSNLKHSNLFRVSNFDIRAFQGMVITVGDEVTRMVQTEYPQLLSIAIVDFRVNRKEKYASLLDHGFSLEDLKRYEIYTVKNPPGHVSASLARTIKKSIKRHLLTAETQVIRVIGEEDLAGIPVILFAPLGSTLIYGQPPAFVESNSATGEAKEGIVVVEVTEEKKHELLQLLGRR